MSGQGTIKPEAVEESVIEVDPGRDAGQRLALSIFRRRPRLCCSNPAVSLKGRQSDIRVNPKATPGYLA
jgi:hypothetical protein